MKKIVITLALALTSLATFAQETAPAATPEAPAEKESKFAVAIDVVAPYLWRGIALNSTSKIAFQPYASYAVTDKLTIGTWGTSNLSSDATSYNEIDWYASYQVTPVIKLMISDYYYNNTKKAVEASLANEDEDDDLSRFNYWDFDKTGGHVYDLSLLFDFSEEGIPVDFQVNTLVSGNDLNDEGKQNHSTYAEMGYSHSIESAGIDLRAFAGGVVNKSAYYVTDGPVFTNVGLNMSKEIKITGNYSLPVFLRYTYNERGNLNKDGELKRNFISGGITFTIK
jgi:hypothetical protein